MGLALREKGWRVIEAADGVVGLALAAEHRPAAILSDLLMPGGNGYAFCRAIREHPDLRHTPVIVLTGRDYPADRLTIAEAGVDEYLVKPIDLAKLIEVLGKHTGKNNGTPAPAALATGREGETALTFWGVRGSVPTPGPGTVHYGGNTSCLEVRADGEIIVLDAGTGIRSLGLALQQEFAGQPLNLTLLVTHTHWDHIQGFPFFAPAYEAANRLRVLGYEGASASLAATLAVQMESPYFPIPLAGMPGNLIIEELRDLKFSIGRVQVEASYSRHPGVCVGYRLGTSAGSVVYIPDNEWCCDDSAGADAPAGSTANPLPDFVRGADILVIDAQYIREEYARHVGWGHGCVDDVVRLALSTGVKHLYLFHHDPLHDDAFISRMVDHARKIVREAGSTLPVDAAREGERVVLRVSASTG